MSVVAAEVDQDGYISCGLSFPESGRAWRSVIAAWLAWPLRRLDEEFHSGGRNEILDEVRRERREQLRDGQSDSEPSED